MVAGFSGVDVYREFIDVIASEDSLFEFELMQSPCAMADLAMTRLRIVIRLCKRRKPWNSESWLRRQEN